MVEQSGRVRPGVGRESRRPGISQQRGQAQRGNKPRHARHADFSQRLVAEMVDCHRQHAARGHRGQQARNEAPPQRMEHKISAERAEHIDLAVRPVHNADDAVYGRPADGYKRVNSALREAVDDLLEKYHGISLNILLFKNDELPVFDNERQIWAHPIVYVVKRDVPGYAGVRRRF